MTPLQQLRPLLRDGIRRWAWLSLGAAGALLRPLRRGGGDVPRSILVVRLDLLGDVMLSRPALQGLRRAYPHAWISMLTLPYTGPLAALFPEVDEVITVDTNLIRTPRGTFSRATWTEYWRVWRALRRRHFDLALSLSGQMASLCAALSGARRVVGYAGEAYPFLLTDALPGRRYGERMHEIEYVRRLAQRAGADEAPDWLELPLPGSAVAHARPLVVVHPGAGHGSAKRWPVQNWIACIQLIQRRSGARVLLVGASSDAGLADAILAAVPSAESVIGDTDVPELVRILAAADVVLTADSAPMHLAAALGRPVVALFGPTDPEIYGPRGQGNSVVLRLDVPCGPCYTARQAADCPLGDPVCMRLLSPSLVAQHAVRFLGLPRAKDQFLVAKQDTLQNAERGQGGDE